MMPRTNTSTVDQLRRSDKHYVANGEGLLFAPPHPLWLDSPGFWDGVQLFRHLIRPAFTISFVMNDGRALGLVPAGRTWSPAELCVTFDGDGLRITEHRVLLPDCLVISECTIENARAETRHLAVVAWTALEGSALVERDRCGPREDGSVSFTVSVPDVHGPGADIALSASLRLEPAANSWAIAETQTTRRNPNPPDWQTSPLRTLWADGRLSNSRRLAAAAEARTRAHIAVASQIEVPPRHALTLRVVLQLAPVDARLALATRAQSTPDARAAAARSQDEWNAFFDSAPALKSSDPYFDMAFAHRWYGLRLNFLAPAGNYAHPTVAEGTDFFHNAVSYSAWCHVRELRWLNDPGRARGVIRTFLQHQRPDGSFPGIIALHAVDPTASYFADWGPSVLALDEVHPEASFLGECYQPLCRYAAFMDRQRDPEATGLYRVLDPYETGQETMSRYTAVDAEADRQHFEYRLQLIGVDLTIYMYRLRRALARIAASLGQNHDVAEHDRAADRIALAVRARLWNQDRGMFSDLNARTGQQTAIKAATCFYPYLTDITGPEHVHGLERNLFDPHVFWTPFPVPSTAADDPTFDADGFWKGVRQNCPWNGRVWPMANSHVAEALATVATSHAPQLRPRAAGFLQRFIRMMFDDGDATRPNAFEHYSPLTGEPCRYRGLDDYQHSWLNDLLIRWVLGFRPTAAGFIVDPLPCGLERAQLSRLRFRGHVVALRLRETEISAEVDGKRHRARDGEPLTVHFR
jgi:hypothetical protein